MEREGAKEREGKEKERKIKKEKDNRSKEGGRGVGNFGWKRKSSKV